MAKEKKKSKRALSGKVMAVVLTVFSVFVAVNLIWQLNTYAQLKVDKEKLEAEIAEEKDGLKKDLLKGGLFSEEEVASAEIAELIERRDKSAIKTMIADRYIASFNNDVAEDTSNDETNTATASLEVDEVNESPSSFMTKFLLNN